MAKQDVTIFTCDRCGLSQNVTKGEQPANWRRVTVTKPVLALPLETSANSSLDWQICETCTVSLINDWKATGGRRQEDKFPTHSVHLDAPDRELNPGDF